MTREELIRDFRAVRIQSLQPQRVSTEVMAKAYKQAAIVRWKAEKPLEDLSKEMKKGTEEYWKDWAKNFRDSVKTAREEAEKSSRPAIGAPVGFDDLEQRAKKEYETKKAAEPRGRKPKVAQQTKRRSRVVKRTGRPSKVTQQPSRPTSSMP